MRHEMTCVGARIAVLTALVFVAQPALSAQSETIPEAVARGATGHTRTAPSGLSPKVGDILKRTDVIVRGVIGESRSYLSDDRQNVFTDFELKQITIVHERQMRSFAQPGLFATLSVTQLGGRITINGAEYTQIEEGLPLLVSGTECLLFLQQVGQRYHIADTFFGAFEISANRLRPLTAKRDFAPEYRDVPVEQAVLDALNRIRALQ